MNEEGNILLGGIFDIHQSDPNSPNGECSNITNPHAVQALEAMIYSVNEIMNSPNLLPGVQISVTLLNSCRHPERAKRHLLEHMDGDLTMENRHGYKNGGKRHVTAVVGAASSDVSKEIAEMLASMGVAQVSYASTAPDLSDKTKYPTFMRTVPSDVDQAHVLVDLLVRYKWTYVKLVYSTNVYGNSLAEQFLSLATNSGICVATQVKLEDYFTKNESVMKNIVSWYLLNSFQDAKVVVMLTTDVHARAVLEAVYSIVTTSYSPWQQNLTWVATDHWGSLDSVVKDFEKIARNAITLDFDAEPNLGFMNNFANLTPNDEHAKQNPWFAEYWQQHFNCHLHSQYSSVYKDPCDPELTLRNEYISMSSTVPFVMNAVASVIYGIHWLVHDQCGFNHTRLCPEAIENMHSLHHYIKDEPFYRDESMQFDVLGNGKARYRILRFTETANGIYRYGKVCCTLQFPSYFLVIAWVFCVRHTKRFRRTFDITVPTITLSGSL